MDGEEAIGLLLGLLVFGVLISLVAARDRPPPHAAPQKRVAALSPAGVRKLCGAVRGTHFKIFVSRFFEVLSASSGEMLSVHSHLFIIGNSQFRPAFNFKLGPWGMRMGDNRSDKIARSSRRTNDLLVLNKDDVLDLLRAAVKREGSQTAFAKHHGLNRSYLNEVLRGKRPMGQAVADALALRIVYIAK